ncbi:MAG: DUF58 domain-containing protein [Planctomycetota bacterium]|nr:DUF58 domain-containing protein [Planctomycetota bacterium]
MNWEKHPLLRQAWVTFLSVISATIISTLIWNLYHGYSLRRWFLLALLSLLVCSFARSLLRRYLDDSIQSTRTRLTTEGKLLLVAIVSFALLGMNTGSNLLYLSFGSLMSALIVSRLVIEVSLRGLKVRRVAPSTVVCGEECWIEIWLRNERAKSSHSGLIVEEDWEFAKSAGIFFPNISPGETVGGTFALCFTKRGEAKLSRLVVRTSFPMGLIEKMSYVDFEATILVLPKVFELSPSFFQDFQSVSAQQGSPSLMGQERWDMIRNIRAYRPGDPLRNVHWKSTARRQALMVKEYDRPKPQQVVFVLYSPVDSTEEAVEAAVSLTASMMVKLASGDEDLALITHTKKRIDKLVIGDGATLHDAMEVLALASTGGPLNILIQKSRALLARRKMILVSAAEKSHPDLTRLRSSLGNPPVYSAASGLRTFSAKELGV